MGPDASGPSPVRPSAVASGSKAYDFTELVAGVKARFPIILARLAESEAEGGAKLGPNSK